MKFSTETYTPLIKTLQDLNQEIRQRLSSMPYSTEPEMLSLGLWLEEVERTVKDLDNASLMVYHHLRTLTDRVQREAKSGFVKGLDGRKLTVRSAHAALNTLLQGAGAIVMKKALMILNDMIIANMVGMLSL